MKAGIVGLGLIGGSFAKAYHAAGHTVWAKELDRSTLSFAELSATPLERALGLRTLTLRTAGDAVRIRGLERAEAERLRDNLIHIEVRKAT